MEFEYTAEQIALRKAVRDYLSKHPIVKELETAPQEQGGEGVTIVRL